MRRLTEILHGGGWSLVVDNGAIRTFSGRGVSDLYGLLTREPETLRGASVADKVVGKGAAALMVLGGVKEVYADVASAPALGLSPRRASGSFAGRRFLTSSIARGRASVPWSVSAPTAARPGSACPVSGHFWRICRKEGKT